MNLSNDLSGNTGDGSSGSLNENISASDIKDNWMDEINIKDLPSQICISFNNLENPQSQLPTAVHRNMETLSLPHQDSLPYSKRGRTRYTTYQIYEMEKVFQINGYYVAKKDKKELAERLNLTELNVTNWFRNRRIKEKKDEKKRNQSQNTKPTVSNEQPELNVQIPMYSNNANNTEKNVNSGVHPAIQQFQNYRPSSTINVPRNNFHPTFPSVSATNWRGEHVRNIGYPHVNSLNYLNNNQSRLQGLPPPPPPPTQVVTHPQVYQFYNQLFSHFQNRPRFPPQ